MDMDLEYINSLFQKKRYTKHLCTRPYRSPEVILLGDHDSKVDIWGAGTIFAEILLTIKNSNRKYLFNG